MTSFLTQVQYGDDKRPLTDGRSGMAVVQVLEAAQRSLENGGKPVPVEPT